MTHNTESDAGCWRSECRTGCYYPDVCSERPPAENDVPSGVVRVDSWKVICQECRAEFENGMGWTIFGDSASYAVEEATDSDWVVREGLVLCVSCWEAKPFCRDDANECIRRDVSEADDGWLYCPDHIEQGMDTRVTSPAVGDAS